VGFEAQFGTKFVFVEKGLITAIPYLPAAVALFFATRRGVTTGHIVIPAVAGALSIPLALYAGSPGVDCRCHHHYGLRDLFGAADLLDRPNPVPHRSGGGGRDRVD
jgi:hypothetical protein